MEDAQTVKYLNFQCLAEQSEETRGLENLSTLLFAAPTCFFLKIILYYKTLWLYECDTLAPIRRIDAPTTL